MRRIEILAFCGMILLVSCKLKVKSTQDEAESTAAQLNAKLPPGSCQYWEVRQTVNGPQAGLNETRCHQDVLKQAKRSGL